jgi:Na+-translocating ferredoxin:NAD+ oxidoreductase RnfG subunit
MKHLFFFFLLIPCLSTVHAATVYLTPQEALKITFPDSEEIVSETKNLSTEQKQFFEKKLGALSKTTWNFYLAKTNGQVDGYALIDNEKGKMEPITFMTAINPDGSAKAVEILIYRESHGAEVHEKNFVKQYVGKRALNPIRVGQDIKNISGATISCHAVTLGVKRALALWNLFYGK